MEFEKLVKLLGKRFSVSVRNGSLGKLNGFTGQLSGFTCVGRQRLAFQNVTSEEPCKRRLECRASDITGMKEIQQEQQLADVCEKKEDQPEKPHAVDAHNGPNDSCEKEAADAVNCKDTVLEESLLYDNSTNIVDEKKPQVDENNNVGDQQVSSDFNASANPDCVNGGKIDEEKAVGLDSEQGADTFVDRLLELKRADLSDLRNLAGAASKLYAAAKTIRHFRVSTETVTDKLKLIDLKNRDEASVEGLKYLISSMGEILRSERVKKWQDRSTSALLTAITTFCTHDDRSVRTAVVATLKAVLADTGNLRNGCHPPAKAVGKYILLLLRNGMPDARLLTVIEAVACSLPVKTAMRLAERVIDSFRHGTQTVRRAAFGCLYELFRRDPTGPFMPHWRRAQLQRFVESLWKYQPASSDHSDAALWLKAFAEAQVLAAKERASSEGMLIETLETCIELSTRRSKLLGETLHAVLRRLLENCVQQSSTAVECLELFASYLTTDDAAVMKFVLKSMTSLFEVAKASVLGQAFQSTLRRLAVMHESNNGFTAMLEQDSSIVVLWLKALAEAHVLAAKEGASSVDLLVGTLETCVKLSSRQSKPLEEAVLSVLQRLLENCVKQNSTVAVKCLELFASYLTADNAAVLMFVLKAMSTLFKVARTSVLGAAFQSTLRKLAVMHVSVDGVTALIEEVFGSAIRNAKVEPVLSVVNIGVTTEEAPAEGRGASLLGIDPEAPQLPVDFPNSWLLPVMKNNICNEPLSMFVNDFLPTVTALHDRIVSLHPRTAEPFSSIESQTWDLLPSFLKSAPDFNEGFPDLAQKLPAVFSDRPALRHKVLASVRAAIKFSSGDPDRESTMTSCAKTLLPNLVAFYLNSGGRHDTKVLDRELLKTVRDYAPMAPAKLLASFAKGCMRRVKDKNGSVFVEGKRNALVCNLLTAIAKHAPPKVLTMMMAVVRAWLSSEEPVLVKQAHKLIEEVASRVDQQDLWSFFNENRDFATDLVMHKAKDSIPMDFRLRIYHWIFFAVKDYSKTCEYVQYACRDIILCLDHSNSRSVRKLAEECFDAVCRRIVSFGMDPQKTNVSLKRSLDAIYRLTSPTPDKSGDDPGKMASVPTATVCSKLRAMRMVAVKQLNMFTQPQLERFVDDVCAALRDTRRAVRLLAMVVARVLCERLSVDNLKQYKKRIFESFFASTSWDVCNIAWYARCHAFGRFCEALIDSFGRNYVKAAVEDRLFSLIEKRFLLNKLAHRFGKQRPQQHLRRRPAPGIGAGEDWDDLRTHFDFSGKDDQRGITSEELVTICEHLDFKFPRFLNNYNACSFIVAIQALGSVGTYFIEALRRRVNEPAGGPNEAPGAGAERGICRALLRMLDKGDGRAWERHIAYEVRMDGFRQMFANVTGADPAIWRREGIEVYKATDALINLLRVEDQRHFQVVTKKAFKCPNARCNAINRIPRAQTRHDNHFSFALPDGNYHDPYWQYVGRRWEEFDDTMKTLDGKTLSCTSCGEKVNNVSFRERLDNPVDYLREGADQNPQHRYLFVFYEEVEVKDGKFHLSVTPQLEDAFNAHPVIARQPYIDSSNEWECRLVGYALTWPDYEHVIYRYHHRDDKRVLGGDRYYHLDHYQQFSIPRGAYVRRAQRIPFALFQYMNRPSEERQVQIYKQRRIDRNAFLRKW